MKRDRVIDCDGHLLEPHDLWERYLPTSLRAKAPRLVRDRQGGIRIAMEGRLYPQPEGKGKGFPGLPEAWYAIDAAGRVQSHDIVRPQSRLRAMDTDGIDVAVPFPTLGLYTVDARDPELNAACCRAYNDWLFTEYLAADRARLVGVGMVALRDVSAAVAELRRCVTELGFKGVYLRPNPIGARTLEDPAHDPFWAEAERLGVPVMFHEGTDGQLPTAGLDRYDNFFMTHMISHPFEQMLAALSMIAGGVLERWEKRPQEVPWLKSDPVAVFRRQCIISCDPDEATIPAVVDYIGEDYVCWASDYPHWDAIFPGAVEELRKHMSGLGESAQRKILGENALRFLTLDGRAA